MNAGTRRPRKVNRRGEILAAAEKIMHSRGLTGITTREIAQQVGCSEGALYFHFSSRLDLLLAMLKESLPDMLGPLGVLRDSVGRSSPHANLASALRGIFEFHRRIVTGTGSLFAEPMLLVAYRECLARQDKGPQLSMAALADYIAAEQDLGRIDTTVSPQLAAYLLMSSSFYRAFMEKFTGKPMQPSWNRFSRQLVAAVAPLQQKSAPNQKRKR